MDFDDRNLFDEPLAVDGSFDASTFFSSEMNASFTPANGQAGESTSTQTVSPHDIFLDPLASDPSSTAFTNLTTPSMYDGSPDLNSLEASPMFSAVDEGHLDKNNQWFSLFPDQDATDQQARHPVKGGTPAPATISASPMTRTISLDNASSTSSLHRLSLTNGISKHRRSVKALGPIEVDSSDSTAVKRAKNTLAARKSRQKKRDVEDALRAQVEELTAERDQWRDRAIARGFPVPQA